MRKTILKFNQPTITGRIYTRENVEYVPDNVFVYAGDHFKINDIAGVCQNIVVDEDGIHGEIELFDTPSGKIIQEFPDYALNYYASGIGMVKENVVSGYRLRAVGICASNADFSNLTLDS